MVVIASLSCKSNSSSEFIHSPAWLTASVTNSQRGLQSGMEKDSLLHAVGNFRKLEITMQSFTIRLIANEELLLLQWNRQWPSFVSLSESVASSSFWLVGRGEELFVRVFVVWSALSRSCMTKKMIGWLGWRDGKSALSIDFKTSPLLIASLTIVPLPHLTFLHPQP